MTSILATVGFVLIGAGAFLTAIALWQRVYWGDWPVDVVERVEEWRS